LKPMIGMELGELRDCWSFFEAFFLLCSRSYRFLSFKSQLLYLQLSFSQTIIPQTVTPSSPFLIEIEQTSTFTATLQVPKKLSPNVSTSFNTFSFSLLFAVEKDSHN
jgi:hypothetical protein